LPAKELQVVTYNLSHLTQPDPQRVIGPIQDDEALLLFALIRVLRIGRVLELGFLDGYSAVNFLRAVGPSGSVYSCDIGRVPKLTENHFPICKSAADITAVDLGNSPVELLFFDCHDLDAQLVCFDRLKASGMITDSTILVLHDTGTHPGKLHRKDYKVGPAEFVHQPVERAMVNRFAEMGYSPLCLHIDPSKCSKDLPFRHGITIMSRFSPLKL
jgi:hypothetical protein